MKLFFSVGEPSGDVHGANLIRALKSEYARLANYDFSRLENGVDSPADNAPKPLIITGFGGPKMRDAGCDLKFDLTQLAVMWVGRVLWNIRKFFQLADVAEEYFKTEKPDAVILIDYPGFNWHIAKRARQAGIPVYYYSPPQIWGWAQWRVSKMRKWVNCALSGLSFETEWLNERGCRCLYVGHPFFDEVVRHPLDETWIQAIQAEQGERMAPRIGILPGSRTQEVQSNLETFLAAAQIIEKQYPDAQFLIAAFREKHRELIQPLIDRSGLNIQVFVGKTPEIMSVSDVVMSVSGSVSLELLYHLKPTVILYRVSRFGLFIQRFFRKVKYITLVNLLCYGAQGLNVPDSPDAPRPQDALYPEFLTASDESQPIAEQLLTWIAGKSTPGSPAESDYKRRRDDLTQLREQVCQPGAAKKSAQLILSEILDRTCATSKKSMSNER